MTSTTSTPTQYAFSLERDCVTQEITYERLQNLYTGQIKDMRQKLGVILELNDSPAATIEGNIGDVRKAFERVEGLCKVIKLVNIGNDVRFREVVAAIPDKIFYRELSQDSEEMREAHRVIGDETPFTVYRLKNEEEDPEVVRRLADASLHTIATEMVRIAGFST